MLRFLFPRLTPPPSRGQALFDFAVAEARKPHWFTAGGVADSVDGRFAMLATVTALLGIRLEASGPDGIVQSAALTERFVEAMDAEHRQMGMNDPTLGKTVRKMVGSLSRRVTEWRAAIADESAWNDTASKSVFAGQPPSDSALAHVAVALADLWRDLNAAADSDLLEGNI